MSLQTEFDNILENIENIPHGIVKRFAENLESRVNAEIDKLQADIAKLKESYYTFGQKYVSTSIMPKNKILKKIGNVTFTCNYIKNYREAMKYPYVPCIMQGVDNLFFIAFPELGQVLPVSSDINLINIDNIYTRIHFGMYNDTPMELMASSTFAVVPHNSKTWQKFQTLNSANWSKIMKPVKNNIGNIKNFPINSTNCLYEIASQIDVMSMGAQWNYFAQMYFLLYLFRQCANREHFTF